MSNEITVAELAKELDVSKQLIYYHSKKISKDYQIRNQSNQLVFNHEQVLMIKGLINKKDDIELKDSFKFENHSDGYSKGFKEDDNVESTFEIKADLALIEAKDEQIQILKEILKKKDERIDTLLEQVTYSQKLIDQQQQLDQYRNKLYLPNDITKKQIQRKWWMFWK